MTGMIITDRLVLRKWRNEDIPAFSAMCADPETMAYFPKLFSAEETIQMIITDRLILSEWRNEDMPTFSAMCADPETMGLSAQTPFE